MTDLYPRGIKFAKNIDVNFATCNGICSLVHLPNMKNRVLLSDHYILALIIKYYCLDFVATKDICVSHTHLV